MSDPERKTDSVLNAQPGLRSADDWRTKSSKLLSIPMRSGLQPELICLRKKQSAFRRKQAEGTH